MPSPPLRSAQLLHADEDQLDRAAIALRSGTAFVVAVCPAELRRAALGRLRGPVQGLSLPEPVEVGSPEEMMAALVEQVDRRDRVLSLVLGRDVDGALDGLNLHREKVVKGGPVILWLEDVAALRKMRERAPDAFSFRSTMVVVRGDGGPVPASKSEEPESVMEIRKRLKRARTPLERAHAGESLAEGLRTIGRLGEAESTARRALLELSSTTSDGERLVKASLCLRLGAIYGAGGKIAQSLSWALRAQAEVEPITFARGLALRVVALDARPGPIGGRDRLAAAEALRIVRAYGPEPDVQWFGFNSAAQVALAAGDHLRARAHFVELRALKHLPILDRALILLLEGGIEEAAGKLVDAEDCYRAAATIAAEGGIEGRIFLDALIGCMAQRGELDAAEMAIVERPEYIGVQSSLQHMHRQAQLALGRGDPEASVAGLRRLIEEASKLSVDGLLFDACRSLAAVAVEAQRADRLSPASMATILVDLDVAQNLLLSLSGPDGPPWYAVGLLEFRANVFAVTPATLPQALDLFHQAVNVARATCPDLIPETARAFADNLLVAAKPDDALSVIADVEPYASQNGFLKERARLLADRVLALVQRGDDPSAIDPQVAALREALAVMDSPRTTAGTLRDLASRLPPTASTPDPLALAEEAHPLFVAMPMPAEDARCLELMGDVLLARGRPDEAKRRFLNARARLARYGLGLRVPLLNKKISAIA